MTDPITQFLDSIVASGLKLPPHIEADGALHRFSTNGHDSDDSGWYVLYADGPVAGGAFGDWRSDIHETWRADIGRKLTDGERREHRRRMDALKRRRDELPVQWQLGCRRSRPTSCRRCPRTVQLYAYRKPRPELWWWDLRLQCIIGSDQLHPVGKHE